MQVVQFQGLFNDFGRFKDFSRQMPKFKGSSRFVGTEETDGYAHNTPAIMIKSINTFIIRFNMYSVDTCTQSTEFSEKVLNTHS